MGGGGGEALQFLSLKDHPKKSMGWVMGALQFLYLDDKIKAGERGRRALAISPFLYLDNKITAREWKWGRGLCNSLLG